MAYGDIISRNTCEKLTFQKLFKLSSPAQMTLFTQMIMENINRKMYQITSMLMLKCQESILSNDKSPFGWFLALGL